MNSKNEKHFPRKLNIKVCDLLEALTETDIKSALKNKRSWNYKTQ